MKVFVINAEDKEGVRDQLNEAKTWIEDPSPNEHSDEGPSGPPFGIVINGHSLVSEDY